MKQPTKKIVFISCVLSIIILLFLVIRYCVLDPRIFLSEVNSMSKDGVTMEIERLFITEDRLAVSVIGSRDDGETMGAGTWARECTFDWYGTDMYRHDSGGSLPSDDVHELFWSCVSPYKITDPPAYGVFKAKDLAYQEAANTTWIVRHRGPWELCFPIKLTHPTISKSINKDILVGGTLAKANSLRLDVLGVTLNIEKVLPNDNWNPDSMRTLDIEYNDGSHSTLELSEYSDSELRGDTSQENLELNYTVSRKLLAISGDFTIIDLENIKGIYFNEVCILDNYNTKI